MVVQRRYYLLQLLQAIEHFGAKIVIQLLTVRVHFTVSLQKMLTALTSEMHHLSVETLKSY